MQTTQSPPPTTRTIMGAVRQSAGNTWALTTSTAPMATHATRSENQPPRCQPASTEMHSAVAVEAKASHSAHPAGGARRWTRLINSILDFLPGCVCAARWWFTRFRRLLRLLRFLHFLLVVK